MNSAIIISTTLNSFLYLRFSGKDQKLALLEGIHYSEEQQTLDKTTYSIIYKSN